MKKRGKFIVIEGTDGAGKATQTKLLARELRQSGHRIKSIAFPQYGQSSAKAVESYLNGEYGTRQSLGPYRIALFYAIDRVVGARKIEQWLRQGYTVLADRYYASNLAFGGASLDKRSERLHYYRWNRELELGVLKLPRPDVTVILTVPTRIAQRLILLKKLRSYLKRKKRDLHERDLRYQETVVRCYHELSKIDRTMVHINCAPKGKLLSIPDVHQLVMKAVRKQL